MTRIRHKILSMRRRLLPEVVIGLLIAAIPSGYGYHLWKLVIEGTQRVTASPDIEAPPLALPAFETEDESDDPCSEDATFRACLRERLEALDDRIDYYPDKLCTDGDGNQGLFDVVIFSESYSWVLGKDEQVELNDLSTDLRRLLGETTFADYLREAPVIYAVGTASCEGYESDKNGQIDLARNRANFLKGLIEPQRPLHRRSRKPTQAICLGVYSGPCEGSDTRHQRRVILMALFDHDPHLDDEDCIRKVLAGDETLVYLAESYEPGFSTVNPGLTCR